MTMPGEVYFKSTHTTFLTRCLWLRQKSHKRQQFHWVNVELEWRNRKKCDRNQNGVKFSRSCTHLLLLVERCSLHIREQLH